MTKSKRVVGTRLIACLLRIVLVASVISVILLARPSYGWADEPSLPVRMFCATRKDEKACLEKLKDVKKTAKCLVAKDTAKCLSDLLAEKAEEVAEDNFGPLRRVWPPSPSDLIFGWRSTRQTLVVCWTALFWLLICLKRWKKSTAAGLVTAAIGYGWGVILGLLYRAGDEAPANHWVANLKLAPWLVVGLLAVGLLVWWRSRSSKSSSEPTDKETIIQEAPPAEKALADSPEEAAPSGAETTEAAKPPSTHRCTKCSKENKSTNKFCVKCGNKLESPPVTQSTSSRTNGAPKAPKPSTTSPACAKCGTVRKNGTKFCTTCGTPHKLAT